MPTSYTAGIEDGSTTTLRDFALMCARAMGACVMQREEPLDAPPRYRVKSNYHELEISKAEEKLKKLQEMSLDEAGKIINQVHAKAVEDYQRNSAEYFTIKGRYEEMKQKVLTWSPPSKDHEGLKTFMLQQIDMCLTHLYCPDKPKRPSAQDWLDSGREKAAWSIGYHQNEMKQEEIRVNSTNRWLDQLTESLSK